VVVVAVAVAVARSGSGSGGHVAAARRCAWAPGEEGRGEQNPADLGGAERRAKEIPRIYFNALPRGREA
jgi:hypothetical protein